MAESEKSMERSLKSIVHHRNGSYEIRGCSLDEAISDLPGDRVVITDANVDRLYRERLPSGSRVFVVPAGEQSKSVACWSDLLSRLAAEGIGRRTALVALGGGVIGDLAGFVAAAFMRGIPLIQIPTTLLSQVDSSVGGKVGIDLPEGKNLVGAFYPPEAVFICDETLDTLPPREFRNGMAEVWKTGFILDTGLVERLRAKDQGRSEMVKRCIELKRQVVEADEFEVTGERAKLNFGHTVGHAIERLTGFGPVLHGEAISIGMVAEARVGESIGLSEKGTRQAIEECLSSEGLPTTSLVLRSLDMLIDTMRRDKKATAGRLAFSLLSRIGECRLVEDVPEADVRAALAWQ
ncbi:MAG: 3-dehydroquinate synthase [Fimbriimonadales bacterium]